MVLDDTLLISMMLSILLICIFIIALRFIQLKRFFDKGPLLSADTINKALFDNHATRLTEVLKWILS